MTFTYEGGYKRTATQMAKAMESRIRQIATAREMLALEPLTQEFLEPCAAAIEHLQFLQADLQYELDRFKEKWGLSKPVPHKGMR